VQFDTSRTNRKQTLLGFAKIGDDLIDVISAPLLIKLEIPDVVFALLLALLAPRLTHLSYSLNNKKLIIRCGISSHEHEFERAQWQKSHPFLYAQSQPPFFLSRRLGWLPYS